MSQNWRLLSEDGVGAAEGLAFDEALMAGYGATAPVRAPTLRLYSYRDHCALVGRYQNLAAEVDLEACERTGTELGRRLSGGGAIVMGSAQLGVAYVDRAPTDERPRATISTLSGALVAGLATLGIRASFQGKNDLEVDGRKIAGLGLYLDDAGAMLFHASVLADFDVAFMLEVLRVPAAKLSDRAARAVSERITTVSAQTATSFDAVGLRPAIARGFEEAFAVALEPGTADNEERARAEALAEGRYRQASWLAERTMTEDGNGSALLKTPAGLIRVYVSTHGDVVKSAMVAGDFNELAPELAAMETGLRWHRLDHASVLGVVTSTRAALALGVSAEELAATVLEAAQQALLKHASSVPSGPASACEGEIDAHGEARS